nr:hypothetical protein CFP56_05925 [Quercus suber]
MVGTLLSSIGDVVLHHDFQLLSPIAVVVLHHDFQMVKNKENSNPNTKQSQNSSNVRVQWPLRVTTIFYETPNLTQPPNPTPNKGKKRVLPSSTLSKGKKGGTALQLTQQLSRICDVVELRNSVFSVEPSSTIRNVMERVCTLDGIEKGSELYLMAARIFQKREKREMFVVMEEPYLQLQFLQEEARLPLDQGLQLQSQVYSVIAGLVWAGDIPMDYDDHIDNTRLRLIFKVDMYEFRGSAYEGMHSSSLVYLNLFDGGHSCE